MSTSTRHSVSPGEHSRPSEREAGPSQTRLRPGLLAPRWSATPGGDTRPSQKESDIIRRTQGLSCRVRDSEGSAQVKETTRPTEVDRRWCKGRDLCLEETRGGHVGLGVYQRGVYEDEQIENTELEK